MRSRCLTATGANEPSRPPSARSPLRIAATSIASCASAPCNGWIPPRAAIAVSAALRPMPMTMPVRATRSVSLPDIDRLSDSPEVVDQDHRVRGFRGDCASGRPESDADVRGGKRGSVVQAVAHHHHDLASRRRAPTIAALSSGEASARTSAIPARARQLQRLPRRRRSGAPDARPLCGRVDHGAASPRSGSEQLIAPGGDAVDRDPHLRYAGRRRPSRQGTGEGGAADAHAPARDDRLHPVAVGLVAIMRLPRARVRRPASAGSPRPGDGRFRLGRSCHRKEVVRASTTRG